MSAIAAWVEPNPLLRVIIPTGGVSLGFVGPICHQKLLHLPRKTLSWQDLRKVQIVLALELASLYDHSCNRFIFCFVVQFEFSFTCPSLVGSPRVEKMVTNQLSITSLTTERIAIGNVVMFVFNYTIYRSVDILGMTSSHSPLAVSCRGLVDLCNVRLSGQCLFGYTRAQVGAFIGLRSLSTLAIRIVCIPWPWTLVVQMAFLLYFISL